jgi:hypothetical protein
MEVRFVKHKAKISGGQITEDSANKMKKKGPLTIPSWVTKG